METRPGESTEVHVSGAQVLGIRASLLKHVHRRLEERLDQLGVDEDDDEDGQHVQELRQFLVDNIEGQFIETLMDQLCDACIVDDFNYQEEDDDAEMDAEDDSRKVEPYDFALNDKLRTTYQQFEDLVEETCHLRSEIPPQLAHNVHERLTNDVSIVQQLVAQRTEATNTLLQTLLTSPSSPPPPAAMEIAAVHAAKDSFSTTVLSAETIARVAQFN